MQELLSKYDKESSYRKLTGTMKWIVSFMAIAFSCYQIYISIFPPPPAQIHRSIHLAFALGLIFLLFPARNSGLKTKISIFNGFVSLLAIGSSLYWLFNFDALITRVGNFNTLDLIVGGIVILLVLEAARRVVGIPIVAIAIIFMLYALFGKGNPRLFFPSWSIGRAID